jgi:hypothetical protein
MPNRYGLLLRTVMGTLGSGSGALVPGVARDTHDCDSVEEIKRLASAS